MVSRRAILHSDMNSFYASVETMLDPSLRGKAIAVCGATEERHGIVLAKSEPAKRAGVKTGMVNHEAKKLCPELILVPPHYDQYSKYSRQAHEIYYRYTDLVEPFGMDECWLDVTGCLGSFADARELADSIRRRMKEELGLTVSVGVSFNKIFAKLGSDMKKPDALTEITPENFREKVWPLGVGEMIYVGPATEAKLAGYRVRTIGELAAVPPGTLKLWFGVNGVKLWHFANGTDTSPVAHRDYVSPVKSIGHGVTCTADLKNEEEVYRVILELAQDVGHRLRLNGLVALGVQLSVRGGDLGFQEYHGRLPAWSRSPKELADRAGELFRERYRWYTNVRAVTVRAIDLRPEGLPRQLDLYDDALRRERRDELETAVEDIRRRFGKRAVVAASLLGDLKIPNDGRDEVTMPGVMYS